MWNIWFSRKSSLFFYIAIFVSVTSVSIYNFISRRNSTAISWRWSNRPCIWRWYSAYEKAKKNPRFWISPLNCPQIYDVINNFIFWNHIQNHNKFCCENICFIWFSFDFLWYMMIFIKFLCWKVQKISNKKKNAFLQNNFRLTRNSQDKIKSRVYQKLITNAYRFANKLLLRGS